MKIEHHNIVVRDLIAGYRDDGDGGVFGYSGKLNIRPPYQREFVYGHKEREAVIDTVSKDRPLNTMYWAVNDDKTYEIIDGQQRTVSIAQYVRGKFSHNKLKFFNLPDDKQRQILDYKLFVYFCEGEDSEKLAWFKTINIAGKPLLEQELRNAVYSGPWTASAKRYFSVKDKMAHKIAKNYLLGNPVRQVYLETAIKWISGGNIEDYMSDHQFDENAKPMWEYFEGVINWVKATFPNTRPKFMKGVDWHKLYVEYKDKRFDPDELESDITDLLRDDEVTNNKGVYAYVLTRDEKYLNLKAFTDSQRETQYAKQEGVCRKCKKKFSFKEMEGDHIVPWSKNGKTNDENLQMLCLPCNRHKSDK